jgi:transposase
LLEVLVLIITLMAERLNLNSRNSSKPPSSDPNREKKPRKKGDRKPGGQNGHTGRTLEKVDVITSKFLPENGPESPQEEM